MIKQHSNISGYFTVEAAILLPLIFFLLFQLLLLGFRLHDTVALKSADYRLCIAQEESKQHFYSYKSPFLSDYHTYLNNILILNEKQTYIIPVSLDNWNNSDLLRQYEAAKLAVLTH